MSLEIKGKLTQKLAAESGQSKAGKEWTKQSFVIDTGAQYNPDVCFSCFGDKVELLNKVKEGQDINVSFNASSREYNGKYYHNLDAWKIDVVGSNDIPDGKPADLTPEDVDDDLPF